MGGKGSRNQNFFFCWWSSVQRTALLPGTEVCISRTSLKLNLFYKEVQFFKVGTQDIDTVCLLTPLSCCTLPCWIVPPRLLLGRVIKKLYFGVTVSCRAMEKCQIHLDGLQLKVCEKAFNLLDIFWDYDIIVTIDPLDIIPPWPYIQQVRVGLTK